MIITKLQAIPIYYCIVIFHKPRGPRLLLCSVRMRGNSELVTQMLCFFFFQGMYYSSPVPHEAAFGIVHAARFIKEA